MSNITFGFRGIYRPQGSVIEDGSFDDGDHYFLFNPGEPIGPGAGGPAGNTEFRLVPETYQTGEHRSVSVVPAVSIVHLNLHLTEDLRTIFRLILLMCFQA